MKPILVFDLDDTLYDELSYVHSGFRVVAAYIADQFKADRETVYAMMEQRLAHGRGQIFDDTLARLGVFSKKHVRRCLSIYRLHTPAIALYPEADACLDRFRELPLYIVTDGNKLVQHRKLAALNLLSRVKRSFITHRFGIRHAKPSPYCFQRICALENTPPQQVIYIADNLVKDFVGIKPLGYKTIRVLTGQHKSTVMPPAFEADRQIHSLAELDWALINTII